MIKKAVVFLIMLCMFFSAGVFVSAAEICSDTESLADAMHEFGLLEGMETEESGKTVYNLDRAVTRQEAVIMLIRLMGKEKEALNGNWDHPFTDVDVWADKYVGYAYENELVRGVTGTLFEPNRNMNAQQYITFLLRALRYSDFSGGDFSYGTALSFSDSIGLTDGIYSLSPSFTRGDAVWLTCKALLQRQKGGGLPLIKQLKKDGVISKEQYNKGLEIMKVADLKEKFRYITIWENGKNKVFDVYNLYSQPGTGEYSGFRQIRGYTYEDIYPIYVEGGLDSYEYKVVDNNDMDEICYWNLYGVTYKNTRGECYKFFSDTSYLRKYYDNLSGQAFSDEWFRETFGKVYEDWSNFRTFSSGAAGSIVDKFVDMENGIYYHEPRGFNDAAEYFGLFKTEEEWNEELLESNWISESELHRVSGNSDLTFGETVSSMHNYYYGTGNIVYGFVITGYIAKDLMFIYDMPESFALEENAEGTYSGIRFKRENGQWFFNPQDLISKGLLNKDGSLNEDYTPDEFSPEEAKKEWENEWITSDQLESIYKYDSYFMGGEVWIWNDDERYVLEGMPEKKLEKGVVYDCSYNGYSIRVMYDGDLLFDYGDLADAGIIDE